MMNAGTFGSLFLMIQLKYHLASCFGKICWVVILPFKTVPFFCSIVASEARNVWNQCGTQIFRFGFRSWNSDRNQTDLRPNILVFAMNNKNYFKKHRYFASVWGIGSALVLGFVRFSFWSQNSDQTETKPRPNILRTSRKTFYSSYSQDLKLICII